MNSERDSTPRQISRSKAWEESWPYAIGVGAAVGYAFFSRRFPVSPNLKDVFSATANIAGIFAAFLLTSSSILVTLRDSWFKRRAIESGVYVSLIGYMLTAMGWSIAAAVATVCGLVFDAAWNLWWYPYALIFWVFLITTTLAVSVRVLRIFTVLMKYIARE
jgi:hypothetical protein